MAIVTGQKNIVMWNEEMPSEDHVSSDEDVDEAERDPSKPPSPGLMEVIGIPSSESRLLA